MGSIYLIVVNNDVTSIQYKKWQSFNLSENSCMQVLIPPNFGNGHLVMSPSAIFQYKQTTNYESQKQFTIKWNDPDYKFWWPICNPITSIRDQS
jgi:dTDP-4-dehydrorhamnose 3,5-epimerase